MSKIPENQPSHKKETPSYPLRTRCECGSERGSLSRSGPHIKVSCAECGRFAFFAPFRDLIAKGIHPEMIGAELVGLDSQADSTVDLKKKGAP